MLKISNHSECLKISTALILRNSIFIGAVPGVVKCGAQCSLRYSPFAKQSNDIETCLADYKLNLTVIIKLDFYSRYHFPLPKRCANFQRNVKIY